jgi:hypothetical protein
MLFLLTRGQLKHLHTNNSNFLSCSEKTNKQLLGYGERDNNRIEKEYGRMEERR